LSKFTSFSKVKPLLAQSKVSCVQLVNHFLAEIEQKKALNIFIETFDQSALTKAKEVDEKLKAGTEGKLAGMIVSIKDNICYRDHQLSASSKMLQGFESQFSATVVERLLQEDAIIIGRTNCDEFAMGSSNENSFYGSVKNPLKPDKVPGGSSGGAAASVAAELCMLALGSDTGGSIRQPASFCGVIGFKPTYGRVSRNGLIAFASSFDQIGPIANNLEDIALVMEVMAGKDEFDSTLSQRAVPAYFTKMNETKATKKKIAFLDCYVNHEGITPEVKESMLQSIEKLKAIGHQVDMLSFDYLDYMVPTYYVLTTAEASSNLARYDGIHYGYRSEAANNLETTYLKSRSEGFGKEVKRRIMLGTFVLSSGFYDAYYTKAQKVRRLITQKTNEVFKHYDFIISPTTPHLAFNLEEKLKDPLKMYLEDIFTVQANLTGLPAISLPLFRSPSSGLPFGFQLMASRFKELEVLRFSNSLLNKGALKKEA